MWRILLAICFLASIVQAQDVPTADSSRPDAPTQSPAITQPTPSAPQLLLRDGSPVKSPPAPLQVTSYERHSQMRRDRDEEFVVLLCRPYGKLKECPVWNWGSADGLVPVALEMKDVDGLTVRYREGKEYVSHPEGAPVRTSEGLDAFRFKIRAAKDFPLGATTLEGKLTFQRIRDGKLSAPETIAVSIPVTVVKHDTQVTESYWAIDPARHTPLDVLGDALLVVVALPILVPVLIGCGLQLCK